MEKKKIWIEGESWTVNGSDGVPVADIMAMLETKSGSELVEVKSDSETNTTTVTTGHWEEESDKSFQRRLEADQISEKTRQENKSNLVVITTQEYDMLKEKAWQYDDLSK